VDGDLYRDMTHREMQQLIWRSVADFADYAAIEYKLQNGKIADIFYTVANTRIIIEVKTIIKQSLIESAWQKYRSQCDYLVIAGPEQPILDDKLHLMWGWHEKSVRDVGIWFVSWLGVTEFRAACRLARD